MQRIGQWARLKEGCEEEYERCQKKMDQLTETDEETSPRKSMKEIFYLE